MGDNLLSLFKRRIISFFKTYELSNCFMKLIRQKLSNNLRLLLDELTSLIKNEWLYISDLTIEATLHLANLFVEY